MIQPIIINEIVSVLKKYKFDINTEKKTQSQIAEIFTSHKLNYVREYRLDDENILDFFFPEHGIAIEVKIGGQAKKIYRQCERYAKFDKVQCIILVANKATGFPVAIEGKDCYVVNIGKAWM